jgi:hypothetical protein
MRPILPVDAADGQITPLRVLSERRGVDEVVLAIKDGMQIYKAGDRLFAGAAEFDLWRDMRRLESADHDGRAAQCPR